jgi:uncharacterized protein
MNAGVSFYRLSRLILTLLLLLVTQHAHAQTQARSAAAASKPKIRAVTAFVNLDREQYTQQIADAFTMLKRARTIFESRGYEVQTLRISTQPFPEYTKGLTTDQAIAFFRNYDALMQSDGLMASIGPAMFNANDPGSQADLLVEILKNTKTLNASLVVADEKGVRWNAIGAAARVMKKLQETERSQGNFRFAAIALVPPLTPFFPASYHSGFGHQFAIALQSADVVATALKGAPDLQTARQRLLDALAAEAFDVEHNAERIDQETGWAYRGIDLSPAPMKEVSIGAAIEELTTQPVGSPGTMTAAATITSALKEIKVQQTGYSGLMLPVLEDSVLAQRWSEGRLNIDSLLSYSAVCGTGLDTVPLPGDVSVEQLSLIIGDMASLAFKWHKPLSARLLPVTGKSGGETTDFDNSALVNATLHQLPGAATGQK